MGLRASALSVQPGTLEGPRILVYRLSQSRRQFVLGVRRLTRIHTRSVEQVADMDLDDDEIFQWPWIYAVEVGHRDLTDGQCNKDPGVSDAGRIPYG